MDISILDEIASILEKTPSSNLDSEVVIETPADKSQCFLTITHPVLSGKIPQFEDVIEFLKKRGIIDINEETIKKILKERDFGKKHIIAEGRKPGKGENARYLYRFGKIEGKESSLDKFEALPGQLLAVKTIPTKGEDGIDVFGNVSSGIIGDDILMTAGKNTAISRDRTRIYAARNGFVLWKENRCDLEPLISINGDLTEDIEFDGMLEVLGSIKNAQVKIGGNLKVFYNIEDSTVEADGSIEVFQGIIKSKITSRGDIIGNSAIESTISSLSSIIIRTGINDCETKARSIFITGKKGIIMTKGMPPPSLFTIPIVISKGLSGLSGGSAFAEKVIDVEILGNVSHKKTEIKVEKGGTVSASSSIYPKTKITIGGRTQEIIKPIESITFIEEKGNILSLPYKQTEAELITPIYGPTILKDLPSVIIEGENLSEIKKEASLLLQVEKNNLSEFLILEYQSFIFFQKDIDGPWKKLILEIEKKRKGEREKPGSFKIDNLPEGLYLSIYPPGLDGIPIKLEDLIESLEEYRGVDVEVVKEAIIKKDGKPIKIGERQYIPELDGRIILKIEDEEDLKNAKVFLTIGAPRENGFQIPYQKIIKFIEKEGIRLPYDKRKIALALKKKYYNRQFLICQAILPKKGKDACYIYKLQDEPYNYPEAIPGQILAIKDTPSIGEQGTDCKGGVITGILGSDFKIQPGINTFLSQDTCILYASDFGRVFWTNNRCDVERVLEISGDCGEDIGFFGKIIINGSLKRGVKIKADGGVLIKGNISLRCEIISGGTIEIDSDVQGEPDNEVSLSAKGDIIANSISFSNISCGGSLIARTGITDCNVLAKSLVITGRKGIIMTKGTPPPPIFTIPIVMAPGVKGLVGGGRVEIEEFIDVEQIGSVLHKKTDVIVKNTDGVISVQDAIYPKVKIAIGKAFLLATKPYEGGASFKSEVGKIVKHPYEAIPTQLAYIPYSQAARDIPPSIILQNDEIEKGCKFLNLLQDNISSISFSKNLLLFFPKGITGPWEEKEKELALKTKEKEEAHGSFKIDNTQDGAYLIVNPPGIRGIPVAISDILLAASQFMNINEEAIKRTVFTKDGHPVKIGERQYIPELDSQIKIEIINEEGIMAKKVILTIGEPKTGGRKITYKEVLWLLKKKGVNYGINERKILIALKKGHHKPFVVSVALLPTKGEGASYIYKYEAQFEAIPGQILAIKKGGERGKSGINCLGEEISGILGIDFEIIAGRNTNLSEDGDILYAQGTGRAMWDGNKCDIEKTIIIAGDCKEDLDFPGKVIITGSIKEGVKINALGNIEVGGDIEKGCSVSSGERVNVSGHILPNTSISSKYDLTAQSAQESNLTANGAIVINTGMRCKANADRIYIVGKKGVIMSKEKPLASSFTLPVTIEKGVAGLVGGEIEAKSLIFADIIGSVSQDETIIKLMTGGRVSCGCIYPKTKVTIGNNTLEIKKQSDNISFSEEGGRIKEMPYKQEDIVLTEAKIEPQREKHEESIVLLEGEKEKAGRFLNLSDDKLGFVELENKIGLFFNREIKGPWIEIVERIEEQRKLEEEKPASFEIKNLPEGLYISINPAGIRGKPLSLEEIEKGLSIYHNVDKDIIKNALASSLSKPIKIGPRQYIRDVDSRIEVIVD